MAALNRLRVLPPPYGQGALAAGATEALLDPGPRGRAAAAAVAPRDRVLVWEAGSGGRVEELAVSALRIDEDRATLAWNAPLRAAFSDAARAAKGGRTFRLFGHAAPASAMKPVDDAAVPGGIRWSLEGDDLQARRELDAWRSSRAPRGSPPAPGCSSTTRAARRRS